jgi:hypothetical protein
LQIKLPLLGKFEFGRPQLYAALMLVLLTAQAVLFAARHKFDAGELVDSLAPAIELQIRARHRMQWGGGSSLPGRTILDVHDSVLMVRTEQVTVAAFLKHWVPLPNFRSLWLLERSPAIVFSLWLGGALWWVSRRLYNNSGGYVALGLYCTSPAILAESARVNAEILAAWGLFGAIYTSIGVAHTLYAPPAKWRVRIVLLGLAFGFTAAAHLAAAFVALALGSFFTLYLAPGRRLASLGILLISSAIGATLLWLLYGFGTNIRALDVASAGHIKFSLAAVSELANRGNLALLLLFAIALITFALWRRTRYFGNWSALLVFVFLAAMAPASGHPQIWLLPFAFVFIGGIFADLFETRAGDFALTALVALIVVQEVFTVFMVARA